MAHLHKRRPLVTSDRIEAVYGPSLQEADQPGRCAAMGAKNCRPARGTTIESANVREKIRCLGNNSIPLGARPHRAKKAMLHRAWQAGRRSQRKLLPAACWIASLMSVAEMKGFFYGSSTQNALIRIVRGAFVAAGSKILLEISASVCAFEGVRVYLITRGHSATCRPDETRSG